MKQWRKWGMIVLVLVIVAAALGVVGYGFLYKERIYPGVSVQGVDLGGMDVAEATEALQSGLPTPAEKGITLRVGEQAWRLSWAVLDQAYDTHATAEAAYQVGRQSTLQLTRAWNAVMLLMQPHDLDPTVISADPAKVQAAVESVAAAVTLAPTEARLELGPAGVVAHPGQPGQTLDIEAGVQTVTEGLTAGIEEVALSPEPVPPHLAEPEPAYSEAQAFLAQPFTLIIDDPLTEYKTELNAEPATMITWLFPVTKDENGEAHMELKGNAEAATAWVESVSSQLGEERSLDVRDTVRQVIKALEAGEHEARARVRHPEKSYVVQPGDAFFDIAYSFGFPQWRFEEANPTVDPEGLSAGQVLIVPSIDVLVSEPIVPGKRIEINLPEQKLRAYEEDALLFEFTISSGMSTTPTIAGQFQVLMKEEDAYAQRWSLDMPYFMGIYKEGPTFYNGIHELPITADGRRLWGGVLGWPASYGCIILDVGDAEKLFEWAPVGTLVRIEGVAPGTPFGRDETLEGLLEEPAPQ